MRKPGSGSVSCLPARALETRGGLARGSQAGIWARVPSAQTALGVLGSGSEVAVLLLQKHPVLSCRSVRLSRSGPGAIRLKPAVYNDPVQAFPRPLSPAPLPARYRRGGRGALRLFFLLLPKSSPNCSPPPPDRMSPQQLATTGFPCSLPFGLHACLFRRCVVLRHVLGPFCLMRWRSGSKGTRDEMFA